MLLVCLNQKQKMHLVKDLSNAYQQTLSMPPLITLYLMHMAILYILIVNKISASTVCHVDPNTGQQKLGLCEGQTLDFLDIILGHPHFGPFSGVSHIVIRY